MAKKTYVCNWTIKGAAEKELHEGDEASLPDEVAEPLLKVGAVSLKGAPAQVEEPRPGEPASAVANDQPSA